MRIATWNMKQAVAPKKPLPELWDWMERNISPDVIVLTEAKLSKDRVPANWTTLFREGGIGGRRSWGTILAARKEIKVEDVTTFTTGKRKVCCDDSYPGAVRVCDIYSNGKYWATIAGIYAITLDQNGNSCGHGWYSIAKILKDLRALVSSERGRRLIVAGDLNLWPTHLDGQFSELGLHDLIERTVDSRPPLTNCACCGPQSQCGHLWTHKNGNSPNAKRQQIDFIFASKKMLPNLKRVYGGIFDFPDAWEISDHAPVVAEFEDDA